MPFINNYVEVNSNLPKVKVAMLLAFKHASEYCPTTVCSSDFGLEIGIYLLQVSVENLRYLVQTVFSYSAQNARRKNHLYISSMRCTIIFVVKYPQKIAIKFTIAQHLIVDPLKKIEVPPRFELGSQDSES